MAEDTLTVEQVNDTIDHLFKYIKLEDNRKALALVGDMARCAATEIPELEEKLAIEVEHRKAFAKLADKKTDLANFIATDVRNEFADQLATATAQVEQMREALRVLIRQATQANLAGAKAGWFEAINDAKKALHSIPIDDDK